MVVAALDRLAEQTEPDPVTGVFELHEVRAADALVELASTRLTTDTDADRATDSWRIDGDPAGPLRFVRPDGRPLANHPPPLQQRTRDNLNGRFPPDLRLSG